MTSCRTICCLMNGMGIKISIVQGRTPKPIDNCVGIFVMMSDGWNIASMWDNHEDAMKSLELHKVREEGIITQTTRGGDIYLNFRGNEQ